MNLVASFAFLVGATVGSFLNVCIHRIPREESVVRPRSRCPHCEKPIEWFRNIPIASWLVLKGKCAHCRASISPRYPLVEFLTGVLFVIGLLTARSWVELPFTAYFLSALVLTTFIDLDHWIIPDVVTLPGIAIGIAGSFLIPHQHWIEHVAGAAFGGGFLIAVSWIYRLLARREGLGGGDVKFLAMVGALLGFKGALITLVLGALGGSVIGAFLMGIKGKGGKTAIPFGPFLSLGALLAFLFGEAIWQWYFFR